MILLIEKKSLGCSMNQILNEKEVSKKTVLTCSIPRSEDHQDNLEFALSMGGATFILGSNGSGKSALIQHIHKQLVAKGIPIIRVNAHRQNWMSTGASEMTAQSRKAEETNLRNVYNQDQARYTDTRAALRMQTTLYDLIEARNNQNEKIRLLIKEGKPKLADHIIFSEGTPLEQINLLLRLGGLTAQIEKNDDPEIQARHGDGEPFSIAQLSDGERNAIILAADILTAKKGTAFLIDEPERHLHRSIIEPLLTAFFKKRPDCYFFIATHEIALPATNSESQVLLPRTCIWENNVAKSWEIDKLEKVAELPENLRSEILGSRRNILFIEGNDSSSLDLPLYTILFPEISLIPTSSCSNVINSTKGINRSTSHHWVKAFGLIDRDDRTNLKVTKLEKDSIFTLNGHSVETLYYCEKILKAVAKHKAGGDARKGYKSLRDGIIKALASLDQAPIVTQLSAKKIERTVREKIEGKRPSWKTLANGQGQTIEIKICPPFHKEEAKCRKLLENKNIYGLISRYPLRETHALQILARSMGFINRNEYEDLALNLINKDDTLKKAALTFIQPLAKAIQKAI